MTRELAFVVLVILGYFGFGIAVIAAQDTKPTVDVTTRYADGSSIIPTDKLDEPTAQKFKIFALQQQNIQLQYQALRAQFEAQFNASDQVKALQAQLTKLVEESNAAVKAELEKNKLDPSKYRINAEKGVIEEIPASPVSEKK